MGNCDLCNDIIGANAKRFSASQMRKAARAGLRPAGGMSSMASLFGLSQQESHAGWLQMVMSDTSDWALCNSCASRVKKYL